MEVSEYAKYDATGMAGLISTRRASAEDVRQAALRAVEAVNPELNALVGEPFDKPLSYSTDGPFAGVPFLIQDLVLHAEGVPTQAGTRLTGDGIPFPYDTDLMSRFRQAGLATLGRTTTPEFGFNASTESVLTGSTRNPWDPSRSAGGSSGGSGAMVAARAVPVAQANDGGGSIRIPAAVNGLVGLKPAPEEDVLQALEALAEELDAYSTAAPVQAHETPPPTGDTVTPGVVAAAVGALLPEDAIVVEEALTAASAFISRTRGAAPHDYLQITGGAIGIGLPLATGAAIACPDRKVVCLQADGSAMYTVQALWTQAREGLDVTTVILDNRSYAILKWELTNAGAGRTGRKADDLMELDRPALDWVSIARGMGVEAGRAGTVEEFNRLLATGLGSQGPYVIDLLL